MIELIKAATLSEDNEKRKEAENTIRNARTTNP